MRPEVHLGSYPAEGVPHSAPIDRIELAPDGSAALTRDARGTVRVWAALDGSAQPQRVPVGAPRHMSLARRRDGRGMTLALVDSAGEVRLFRTDERGHPAAVASAAPAGRPALAALVLAGGDRVAILRDDHAIELADETGAVLARLEQRGFRPATFAATAAGTGLVAITLDAGRPSHRVRIHRIDVAARGLTLRPSPVELTAAAVIGPSQWALDPSGNRVALLAAPPGPTWHLLAADLGAGTVGDIDLPMTVTERVAIGFVDEHDVVATQAQTPVSLRIDLAAKGAVFPAVTPDTRGGELVVATAVGTRVAAALAWLWVDAASRGALYLGYDQFQATDGAISPDRRWAAWAATSGDVYVRALRGQPQPRTSLSYPAERGQPRRVLFLDDARLMLVEPDGEVRLIDWASGEEIDAVDAGGSASDVDLDRARGLLAVVRQGGQVWLYPVSAAGFGAPLLVADGAERAGFLAGDGPALWTLDNGRKLRTYAIAELTRGMSREEATARGTQLDSSVLGVDRQGRAMVVGQVHDAQAAADAAGARERRLPGGFFRALPSPDGKRVAMWRSDSVLSMFEAGRDAPSWTRAFLTIQNASWSADGSLLAVAGPFGAAVADAADGKMVDLTCGPLFRVQRAPPAMSAFDRVPLATLCEADAAH
ncbi:MAG TPA: hypothetical protein VKB80_02055 [Kofleriaceae bacterium]|nr:hypothetical protein [Kofleriaceae bacterium]